VQVRVKDITKKVHEVISWSEGISANNSPTLQAVSSSSHIHRVEQSYFCLFGIISSSQKYVG